MNSSSGCPAVCAAWRRLSRSGPIVPLAPAGLKVWQPSQPFDDEQRLARRARNAPGTGRPPPPRWLFVHEMNLSSFSTIASERISACPRPQSSVQMTGKVPRRFGVITSFVSRPGTASCFWPNCGTQKEWITSSA